MWLEKFLLVTLVIFVIYLFYERFRLFQLFTRLGIPGPKPNLCWGNLHLLMRKDKLIVDVMSEWEAKFGPYYGYFRGTRPTLVVRDIEVVKDILVKNSAAFINRPLMIMNIPPIPHTVVGLRDQRWKEVRQILSPTFSSAKIKKMLPIFKECLETTLQILREKGLSEKEEEVVAVNAHKLFQGLACDVISGCALAMKVNSQKDPNDKFLVAVKGFLENAMGSFVKVALCFPLLAKCMECAIIAIGYSHEMTEMIIRSVKIAMTARRGLNIKTSDCKRTDALQLMMDSTLSDSTSPALTDDEIIGNAWVFILGGFETTSASLTYTCYLLSNYQEIQEKLYEELKNQLQLGEMPNYEQIHELTYLDQVICESLRLYPPVVNFIVRGLQKDTWVGPYYLPQNVGIQIPVWQIHHDPELWQEPLAFIPERFNNNAKKTFAKNMQFLPFGGGPRNCIGSRFAILNMKFVLSAIVRNFRIAPSCCSQPVKLKLRVPSVTIVPDGEVPLRFIPRTV